MEKNQQNNIEFATFFQRLAAYIIDSLPIVFTLVFVAFYSFGLNHSFEYYATHPEDFSAKKDFEFIKNMLSQIAMVIWILYSFVMDASQYQGTFGKQLLKIKVVNEKGGRLTHEESFKRNTTKLLSMLPMSIGAMWMLFDPKRQMWHDKFGKSLVVRR